MKECRLSGVSSAPAQTADLGIRSGLLAAFVPARRIISRRARRSGALRLGLGRLRRESPPYVVADERDHRAAVTHLARDVDAAGGHR